MKRIPQRLAVMFALVMVLLPWSRASAWLETGHREVALIAWEDLTPATRAKVLEILRQHPRYEQDLLANCPENASDETTARYVFSSAASWPDMVRNLSNPMHAAYHHPGWHYIDIPYVMNEQPLPATRPSNDARPADIVEALTKNVVDLKNPVTSAADKAVALCWVAHLCGDIHQPLHACDLFSPEFPDGDRGGNSFIVLRDPPYPDSKADLHFIWDELPGDFKSFDFVSYIAGGLRNDPRYSRGHMQEALSIKDFAAWAHESHDLAVEYAYQNGALKGAPKQQKREANALSPATRPAAGEGSPPIPGLPPGYLAKAEQVASRQIVLAGYRTADLLNAIFDPH